MVDRIERGFDIAWIVLVIICGVITIGTGMAASWFVFQPFKWLEKGLRWAARWEGLLP